MISRILALIAVVACLSSQLAVAASGSDRTTQHDMRRNLNEQTPTFPVGKSYDEILDRGWMSLGVYANFPPWSFKRDGKLVGIDVDIAKEVAKFIGVEPRIEELPAGENVDADLRNFVWRGPVIGGSVVNVLLHVPYHQELQIRNDLIVLTGKYTAGSLGLAYHQKRAGSTLAAFRYATLGVEIDTLADHLALQVYGGSLTPNVKHYTNISLMKQDLIDGVLDGVLAQKAEVEYLTQDIPNFETVVPVMPGYGSPSWQVGVAVHHAYRALGYMVDDAMAELIASGRMEQIFASYGVKWVAPGHRDRTQGGGG